ncbi:MAG: glycoside hydrolase family 57 protein [Deltaproteobacteria bacterium]|nr:glycoside hydrolase family 57 protein [Deltaproteobacteria bacterium]
MEYPLKVAVIWHMHQPYYKDLLTGEYLLPWVRLHATKDYYDMAAILDNFPGIRQTFNVVPSLLTQIDDYAKGKAKDKFLSLSLKPAADLTDEDKHFLLSNFFLANWDNMIKPFPRYWEILHKRGLHRSKEEIKETIRYFSEEELRDLQVLFNLCWFDPLFLKEDPFLSHLVKKERAYSEEEKLTLLEKQREIVGKVIPNYKRLLDEGRVELTTTPFYHPILPLLCDTTVATHAMPHMNLPKERFKHPEDAKKQLSKGIAYHKELFGSAPSGMWPSEGSVSEEALALMAQAGIGWIATDEEILEASSHARVMRGSDGIPENPEFLYKPYFYNAGGKKISILFRDHQLSDLIGFVYSSWDPAAAARDFMNKLHEIRKKLGQKNAHGSHIVPVILDGENCWEHYKNDGWDFLTNLYGMVEEDKLIQMVTVSEYLSEHPPKTRLGNIFPGSWINHNFKIWIGHDEDNLAWDYLKKARDKLVEVENKGKVSKKRLEKAWEHIYIAEGSDWCWWYGDEHSTENDPDFDILFRKNLMNVYHMIHEEAPSELSISIISKDKHIVPPAEATSFINPVIDGEVTNYFEWLGAADIELEKTGGTMHKASFLLARLFYGFNEERDLFLRLDLGNDVECDEMHGLVFTISVRGPRNFHIETSPVNNASKARVIDSGEKVEFAFRDIFEFSIDNKILSVSGGDKIECSISVSRDGGEIERWPSMGYITIKVPGDDFESKTWNAYA